MADKTTGELPAVKVGDLPLAPDIYDDFLMPGELQGDAVHITGAQFKGYAKAAVKDELKEADKFVKAAQEYADDAKGFMDQAETSAGDAANSAGLAESDANRAEGARTGAEAAQKAIENLGVSAHSIAAGSEAKVTKSVSESGVTLYFEIPRGEQGAVGPCGAQGIEGPEGKQGPPGESGVTTPASGWFTLAGDADGNLWAYYNDTDAPPKFEVDADGNIYYITPDAA